MANNSPGSNEFILFSMELTHNFHIKVRVRKFLKSEVGGGAKFCYYFVILFFIFASGPHRPQVVVHYDAAVELSSGIFIFY